MSASEDVIVISGATRAHTTYDVTLPAGSSLEASNQASAIVDAKFRRERKGPDNPDGDILTFLRRSGRAEMDEHAEPPNANEFFVVINPHSGKSRKDVIAQLQKDVKAEVPGVDVEVDFARPIAGHEFSARLLVNYQPHLIYDLSPAPIVDVGGAADGVNVLPATPDMKALLQVNYEVIRDVRATVQVRYRDGMRQNGNESLIFVQNTIPSAWYADFGLRYSFRAIGGALDLTLNVRNVFNTPPKPWASTGGTGQIGTFGGWLQGDDPLGRYFKLGLGYKY